MKFQGAVTTLLDQVSLSITGTMLGAAGGAEIHTLTNAQMPIHNHGGAIGSHNRAVPIYSGGGSSIVAGSAGSATDNYAQNRRTTSDTASISNDGGGSAHNNTQPSIILNHIIKL